MRVRDSQDKVGAYRGKAEFFDGYLARNAKAARGLKAPGTVTRAVQAAVDLPFSEGMKRERELLLKLVSGPQSAALRYYFFAERQAAKIPDVPADTPKPPIRKVGVIGAGTMGGGILSGGDIVMSRFRATGDSQEPVSGSPRT